MDPDNEFMNLDFEKDSRHPKANLPRLSSKPSAKGASKSLKPHNPEKAKT